MKDYNGLVIVSVGQQSSLASKEDFDYLNLAYSFSKNGQLIRNSIVYSAEKCYMGITPSSSDKFLYSDNLGNDLLYEIKKLKFKGVFIDCELENHMEAVRMLDEFFYNNNITLFVPEKCAPYVKHAIITIETAISGGSFREMLNDYIDKYGSHRIATLITPVIMDFTLPSQYATGTPLSQEDVSNILQRYGSSVFFSRELCTKYFTYMSQDQGHFTIFDDQSTILQKLNIIDSLNIQHKFILYPDYAKFIK